MEIGSSSDTVCTEILEEDDEYDGWFCAIISFIRILSFFTTILVTTFIWGLIMVLLLPWPSQRIKQGNIYGHVTGRIIMWIFGNPIKIEGVEHSSNRAIYISNHASLMDPLLLMWLAPIGTLSIADKGIIRYPLFGQLYVLANQLRIDRSSTSSAIKSMRKGANEVVKKKLSIIIFPEGTRSEDGRLLPFKKGFIHLTLQTKLPIVPIVMTGTHRAWRKGNLRILPTPITVKFLEPIKTHDWVPEKIDEYINFVHNMYVNHLPESQKPVLFSKEKRF
ncbi:uncharacterized protein [Phyllobates terribilis]|uniref:uncharacterized protein n=1 Tax=Phyllobates terribilis TaxID=111132 RepID=UPI003CCA7925